jgi:hypothetical protein
MGAIRSYATHGDLDAKITTKIDGVNTVRDQINRAYSGVFAKIHGKGGLLKKHSFFKLKNSFAGITRQASDQPLAVEQLFTTEIEARQLRRWAVSKMGKKGGRQFMLSAWAGNEYALIGANPKQKGGHSLIHRVKVVDSGGFHKGIMNVGLDNFSAHLLNRDFDQDPIQDVFLRGVDARKSFEQQVQAHATDFNTYLQNQRLSKGKTVADILAAAKARI